MPMDSNDKPQTTKNHHFTQSLSHAWHGIMDLVILERNFRYHLMAAAVVVVAGLLIGLSIDHWLWLALAVVVVLTAETMNTIVETIVNLIVGEDYHDLAKKAKDVAAGGVLMAAGFAVVVGVLVLVPALMQRF